jgi:hypothetical protein
VLWYLDIPTYLAYLLGLVALGMKVFALIDAASRRKDAYVATDHQTKAFWLVLLGASLVLSVLFVNRPMSIFNVATVAVAGVYLAGVRPALRNVLGR